MQYEQLGWSKIFTITLHLLTFLHLKGIRKIWVLFEK